MTAPVPTAKIHVGPFGKVDGGPAPTPCPQCQVHGRRSRTEVYMAWCYSPGCDVIAYRVAPPPPT